MWVYALTIFLSAFLLFQVQPLIAKFILPWFGGSAAVWSASLLFFQLVLLAGYFYAHLLIRYLKPLKQFWVHTILLAAGVATLPIIPKPPAAAAGDPTGRILLTLALSVGLPYMLLSATSPLLQAWYVRTHHGAVPYRLFALSNFGSMLALLSYPALIEPASGLHPQAYVWSAGFAVFALLCILAAYRSRGGEGAAKDSDSSNAPPPPSWASMALWIALSACASVLLLAVTSHLTQNVAPIPLLWVVPLSLYLLTFILCFESDRLYVRGFFLPALAGALGLFTHGISLYEGNDTIQQLILALCSALFVCCMVCHGELARMRPNPRYLTQFYLMVSVGGAVGGLFVALIAPRIFQEYWELPVALITIAALATWLIWKAEITYGRTFYLATSMGLVLAAVGAYRTYSPKHWQMPAAIIGGALLVSVALRYRRVRPVLALATVGFAMFLVNSEYNKEKVYVRSVRNFYGVMHVRDDAATAEGVPPERVLVHGTIDHGTQLLDDKKGRIPTSYFGYQSGISRAIRTLHDNRGALRLGILGLGAGVTATLANKGDTLHYYEINPMVLDVATHQFGFVNGCPAEKKILMGDARLVLQDLPSEQLDFLAMDAFTSDAVPIHLLTREAFQIYLRHLKPNGILAVHISNRYLDLKPVVARAMNEIGWHGRVIEDDGVLQPYYAGTTWVILSAEDSFFKHPNFAADSNSLVNPLVERPGFRTWTDDFSNIISIIK